MNKVSGKLWVYGIGFLIRGIIFNLAFAFSIVALIKLHLGFSIWSILAIVFSSLWLIQNITNHLIWSFLSKEERALYFGIRRYGDEVVKVTQKEINRRTGQQDLLEILRDTDSSLEVQMAINGTITFINIFIGVKWIYHSLKFNKNKDLFKYEIEKK